MSGYLFNYGPGRLNVHFVQCDHGWMYMQLRLRTGVDTVTEVDEGFEPTGSSAIGGELLRRRLRENRGAIVGLAPRPTQCPRARPSDSIAS